MKIMLCSAGLLLGALLVPSAMAGAQSKVEDRAIGHLCAGLHEPGLGPGPVQPVLPGEGRRLGQLSVKSRGGFFVCVVQCRVLVVGGRPRIPTTLVTETSITCSSHRPVHPALLRAFLRAGCEAILMSQGHVLLPLSPPRRQKEASLELPLRTRAIWRV